MYVYVYTLYVHCTCIIHTCTCTCIYPLEDRQFIVYFFAWRRNSTCMYDNCTHVHVHVHVHRTCTHGEYAYAYRLSDMYMYASPGGSFRNLWFLETSLLRHASFPSGAVRLPVSVWRGFLCTMFSGCCPPRAVLKWLEAPLPLCLSLVPPSADWLETTVVSPCCEPVRGILESRSVSTPGGSLPGAVPAASHIEEPIQSCTHTHTESHYRVFTNCLMVHDVPDNWSMKSGQTHSVGERIRTCNEHWTQP